jgi:hypothetical protein
LFIWVATISTKLIETFLFNIRFITPQRTGCGEARKLVSDAFEPHIAKIEEEIFFHRGVLGDRHYHNEKK